MWCCRWQALSRSLERVTAVHGDEGDDQHGIKVHEVHDMQPGLPTHQANPSRGAVGLIPLTVSPRQLLPDQALASMLPSQANPSEGTVGLLPLILSSRQLLPDQATVGVVSQSETTANRLHAQPCIGQGSAAEPNVAAQSFSGHGGIGADAPTLVSETAAIDLCSPVKQSPLHQQHRQQQQQHPQQQHHQQQQQQHHQHQQQQQQQQQIFCLAGDNALTAHKSPGHQPLTMDAPASLLTNHAQLMSEDVSLSQAGKLAMAGLHDNRPAGPFLEAASDHTVVRYSLIGADSQHASTGLTSQAFSGAVECTQGASNHSSAAHNPQQQPQQGAALDPGAGRLQTQPPETNPEAGRVQTLSTLGQSSGGNAKQLLRTQGSSEAQQASQSIAAPALTQAEVIEAQTADQEKPIVSCAYCSG